MAPPLPSSPHSPAVDRLEQRFVFRLGRLVPLGLALLAGAACILAVIVFAGSFVPPTEPVEPTAAPAPAPVAITADDVALHRSATTGAGTGSSAGRPTARDTTTPADAVSIARRLHAVRTLLAAADTPWDNQYRSVCTESYLGYCLSRSQRLTARGAGAQLEPVLALYDEGASTAVVDVSEPGPRRSYRVNHSGAAQKVVVLDEALALIEAAPAQDRLSTLAAWSELRIQREQQRRAAIAAETQRVEDARARARAEHEAAVAERRAWRRAALLTAAITLGSIATLAMLLGVLAIERNTRALRQHAEIHAPGRGGGVHAPAVTPFTLLPHAPERFTT